MRLEAVHVVIAKAARLDVRLGVVDSLLHRRPVIPSIGLVRPALSGLATVQLASTITTNAVS